MTDSIVKQETGLPQLAKRINEEHAACERDLRDGLQHAVEAGKLLIEAKAQHKHGGWLKWLEANFVSTPRTAQSYMWLSKRMPEVAKAKRASYLSIRSVAKEIQREKRQEIVDEKRAVDVEAIKQWDEDLAAAKRREKLVVTEERLGLNDWLYKVTRGSMFGFVTEECIDPEYLELKRTEMDKDLWHLVANVKEGLGLAQQALDDLENHCRLHGNVHEDMHTVDQWDGVEYPCAEILEQGKDVSLSLDAAFGIVDEKLKAEAEAILAECGT